MIGFLKGFVEELKPDRLLLDVMGVGYLVEISAQTYERLAPETEIKLLIYHHFTDNDQRLFGFYTKEEKELFEKLITVKGIGPKSGLTILSGLPAPVLIQAIARADITTLSTVPGIGKKTAERIALELKDKISEPVAAADMAAAGTLAEEIISALTSLGFKHREAEQTVIKVLQTTTGLSLSEAVKKSLNLLNKGN